MKKISTLTALAVLSAGITTSFGSTVAEVRLDGIFDGNDDYTFSDTVTWYNGHETANSIYGDFSNQTFETTIRWGVAKDEADNLLGDDYFFLYVEAPLYAKNMIWGAGLPEVDLAPYRTQWNTHHPKDQSKPRDPLVLDFEKATGSEKLIFVDGNGGEIFKADMTKGVDSDYHRVGERDSSDYVLSAAGGQSVGSSTASNTKFSFEFKFELNGDGSADAQALVDAAKANGIEIHLSPERGLVPEPSSALLLGLSSALLLFRRKR